MILIGQYNQQASVVAAHTVFVAHILCHAEGVGVFHMVDDDEHRLHVEFAVQFTEIVVGTVAEFFREDVVGVANELCGVAQIDHVDVVGIPDRVSVFSPFHASSDSRQACGDEQQGDEQQVDGMSLGPL